MTSRLVKVLWAGRLSYGVGLKLQKILVDQHFNKNFAGETPNTLVLLEHDPVYTVGIRNKGYSEKDESELRELGAEFFRTNRGGLITFHGPGQLVAYPILNMKEFDLTVKCYVSSIEKMVIRLCAEYGIRAETSEDTGVWVGDKKICALGIRASRYITSHGLAINCNTDLRWFDHIVPCGIEEKGVTSLSEELNANVTIDDVLPTMQRAFGDQFGCEILRYSPEEASEFLREARKIVN